MRCDGCGRPATPEHIAQRLRRLELATRFRPIHISILFLEGAPPSRLEDYFYYAAEVAQGDFQFSDSSREQLESLLQGLGITSDAGKDHAARLAEFQRRGYFLADLVECPLGEEGVGLERADESGLVAQFGPTIVKRIQFSYKPRHIALLSSRCRQLIPMLQRAGFSDRVLNAKDAIEFPLAGDAAAQAQFRARLNELLSTALSRAKGA